jgi:glutathione S-transferase
MRPQRSLLRPSSNDLFFESVVMSAVPQLILANKLYSSWSMRPYMLFKGLGIEFTDIVIPMSLPDTRAKMLEHAPTGKVPALRHCEVLIWESLAIMEYAAETWPEAGVWPKDKSARAHARSVSSEMHAGFQALRSNCPVNLHAIFKWKDYAADVHADVARIEEMWADCRARFGEGGPFLFGKFSAADAMYAPVVTRLKHYQWTVSKTTADYMEAVLAHPAFAAWTADAHKEPWHLTRYEPGHTIERVIVEPPITL